MVKNLLFRSNTPRWLIFFIDVATVSFSIFMAYMLRFNFTVPATEIPLIKYAVGIILSVRILSFVIGKSYAGIIRYTSAGDAGRILVICFLGSLAISAINLISSMLIEIHYIPFSIVILEFLLSSFFMVSIRAFIKVTYNELTSNTLEKSKVLIYGAGEAGIIAKRTIDRDPDNPFYVAGFVDDDKKKAKRKLENKVIYKGGELNKVLAENDITHLIISTQSIPKVKLNKIIQTCLKNKVQVLNVPSPSKWINGELSLKQIKKIKIEELLGREPIKLSNKQIQKQLKNKIVLVTGAAGSIGSELVRQIVKFSPKKVFLLDQAESALYELESELFYNNADAGIEVVVGDIRNEHRMRNVFKTLKPELVFHAAAYKHVPLMENNPSEAILTNILGTKILADLSVEFEVETFVMVSTDKAVNPTNVMGASKRIAEIYTQSLNSAVKTKFITTRFGNVLGSNGSVIPLFQKQIDKGGPITVTHPEVTRYFMTIPEACQLILEAGSSGKGGEIFIFDMGKSIKIKDLASQMIHLSGFEEGKDIQIVYTGMRPGEKLYEELLNDKENTIPTYHPQIMIAKVREYEWEEVKSKVNGLINSFSEQNNFESVKKMKQIVPEFKSKNSIYEALDKM